MNPKKLLSLALSSLMAFSGAFCCKAGDPEVTIDVYEFPPLYENIRDLNSKVNKFREKIDSLQDQMKPLLPDVPEALTDEYLYCVLAHNVLCYRLYDSYRRARDIRDRASEGVKRMISNLLSKVDNLGQPEDNMIRLTENDVEIAKLLDSDPTNMLNDHPIPEQYL